MWLNLLVLKPIGQHWWLLLAHPSSGLPPFCSNKGTYTSAFCFRVSRGQLWEYTGQSWTMDSGQIQVNLLEPVTDHSKTVNTCLCLLYELQVNSRCDEYVRDRCSLMVTENLYLSEIIFLVFWPDCQELWYYLIFELKFVRSSVPWANIVLLFFVNAVVCIGLHFSPWVVLD